MISHVVIMTPRVDLSADDREGFIAAFERAVREIPSIRGVRFGRRVVHGAVDEAGAVAPAEFIAIIDFEDLAGLQSYLRHPAHQALANRFYGSLSSAWVVDFETGGVDDLRRLAEAGEGPDV